MQSQESKKSKKIDAIDGKTYPLHYALTFTHTTIDLITKLIEIYPAAVAISDKGKHLSSRVPIEYKKHKGNKVDTNTNVTNSSGDGFGCNNSISSTVKEHHYQIDPTYIIPKPIFKKKNKTNRGSGMGMGFESEELDPSVSIDIGTYPLHIALERKCDATIVFVILQQEPCICTIPNEDLKLPIHFATWKQFSLNIIKSLVKSYPQSVYEVEMKYDNLPIHYAIQYSCSYDVIEYLLSKNTDSIKQFNKNGLMPLHLACKNPNSTEIISMLMNQYPLATGIPDGKNRIPFDYLLENNAPTDTVRVMLGIKYEEDEVDIGTFESFGGGKVNSIIGKSKKLMEKKRLKLGLTVTNNDAIENTTGESVFNSTIEEIVTGVGATHTGVATGKTGLNSLEQEQSQSSQEQVYQPGLTPSIEEANDHVSELRPVSVNPTSHSRPTSKSNATGTVTGTGTGSESETPDISGDVNQVTGRAVSRGLFRKGGSRGGSRGHSRGKTAETAPMTPAIPAVPLTSYDGIIRELTQRCANQKKKKGKNRTDNPDADFNGIRGAIVYLQIELVEMYKKVHQHQNIILAKDISIDELNEKILELENTVSKQNTTIKSLNRNIHVLAGNDGIVSDKTNKTNKGTEVETATKPTVSAQQNVPQYENLVPVPIPVVVELGIDVMYKPKILSPPLPDPDTEHILNSEYNGMKLDRKENNWKEVKMSQDMEYQTESLKQNIHEKKEHLKKIKKSLAEPLEEDPILPGDKVIYGTQNSTSVLGVYGSKKKR